MPRLTLAALSALILTAPILAKAAGAQPAPAPALENAASAAPAPLALASNAASAPAAPSAAQSPIRKVRAAYNATWNGLGVLGIAVNVSITPDSYSADAKFTPEGVTTLTSHLRRSTTYVATSRGDIKGPGAVKPKQYVHQGGKKNRKVELDFTPEDVKTTASPAFGDYGDIPATKAQRLEATDSLSGIVSLAIANPENICSKTLKLFDGKARYDLALSPLGTEKIKTGPFSGTAQKCRADYRRIAGYDKLKKGDKPLFDKPFTIWFAPTQNGLQAPVKIVVQSNWGPIAMNLDKLDASVAP